MVSNISSSLSPSNPNQLGSSRRREDREWRERERERNLVPCCYRAARWFIPSPSLSFSTSTGSPAAAPPPRAQEAGADIKKGRRGEPIDFAFPLFVFVAVKLRERALERWITRFLSLSLQVKCNRPRLEMICSKFRAFLRPPVLLLLRSDIAGAIAFSSGIKILERQFEAFSVL